MLDDKWLIDKYINIGCPYLIKSLENESKNDVIEEVILEREMTLFDFFNSKEYKKIKEKYPCGILGLDFSNTNGTIRHLEYYINGDLYYDKDMNGINITDENKLKYKIRRLIKVKWNLKEIKLKDYIDIMKENKEMSIYKHKITIDEIMAEVIVLFGEKDFVIIDDYNESEIKEDNECYKHRILRIELELAGVI